MTEAEIGAWILRHDARNLQLKRRLAEHGIDFRGERHVRCRFRAPDEFQASLLVQALQGAGFVNLKALPAGPKENLRCWRVEAQIWASLSRVASHEFTEAVVRSAAGLSCIYDGWSTWV